jgi:divalent metal cation (Fe/Co/Zn/Cd) transporter
MDGVDDGTIDQLTAVIGSVPGVVSVGRVRARWSGHRMEADANVAVDAGMSVLESHALAEEIEHRVLHSVGHVENVVVHVNPAIDGREPAELHELTHHHTSAQARQEYLARQGSPS